MNSIIKELEKREIHDKGVQRKITENFIRALINLLPGGGFFEQSIFSIADAEREQLIDDIIDDLLEKNFNLNIEQIKLTKSFEDIKKQLSELKIDKDFCFQEILNILSKNYSWSITFSPTESIFEKKGIDYIDDLFYGIDTILLKNVRGYVKNFNKSALLKSYEANLKINTVEKLGISYEKIVNDFNQMNYDYVHHYFQYPELEIDVETNYERLIYRTKKFTYPIDNPKLLWVCNCKNLISKKNNCKIHNYEYSKELEGAFLSKKVKIAYNNMEFWWSAGIDLWPASFDLFKIANNILNEQELFENVKSIADINCGIGFLGTYISQNIITIENIYFVDWLLRPLLFSTSNFLLNNKNASLPRHNCLLGLNLDPLYNLPNKIDLLLCVPPYIPDFEGRYQEIREETLICESDLLYEVIINGLNVSKKVVIGISFLMLDIATEIASKNNLKLVQFGESYVVPFRVTKALQESSYIKELEQTNQFILIDNDYYLYYHEIGTFLLTRN